MAKQRKYLRTGIYLGNEDRARRAERLQKTLGLTSQSELVRRLVDQEADRRGVFEDREAAQLPLGATLPPARP